MLRRLPRNSRILISSTRCRLIPSAQRFKTAIASDAFNLPDFLLAQVKRLWRDALLRLLGIASTDDRAGHRGMSQHPRDRNLPRRQVMPLVLGIILFGLLIAGMVINTIFLVREIRRNEGILVNKLVVARLQRMS